MFKNKKLTPLNFKAVLKRIRFNFNDVNLSKKTKSRISFITATVLITGIFFTANFRVGYAVKVDDKVLGVVPTKSEYYEVLSEVKEEVETISEIEFEPVAQEEFSTRIVNKDDFTQKEELAENLKALSEEMVEAYTVSENGNFIVALNTEEEANLIVESYIKEFEDKKYEEVSYGAEVTVLASHVPKDTVLSYEDAMQELLKGKCVYHQVMPDETLEQIAENYGVKEEEILSVNDILKISEGVTLKIYTSEPAISIKTVEYINQNIEIPFETIEKEDNTVYEGQTRTEVNGVNGIKYLHAYITKVNGVITEENVIESRIIKEPTTQVELIGTKTPPRPIGTGEFIMPVNGTLTSNYGKRWGRAHAGIDIGAKTGTPIYAADNGIVLESEYQSNGYGNIVKIDHQNGFITYYAHCSSLYVKAGDVVAKGDKIAAVGNTGRSTGPHLHFEIRKNKEAQNPYLYIK